MTQIIAAGILAAGAFYGVYKGAVYAVERLIAQLAEERRLSEERSDAESERLQRQLDAEADRLDKQLAHDRLMREVEELRGMVDEAATSGLQAASAVNVFRRQVRWIVVEEGQVNEMYAAKLRQAQQAVSEMQGFVERFELRIGQAHEIPEAFSSWQLAVEESLDWLETTPANLDSLRSAGKRLTASSERYLDFMEASRNHVRLVLPESGTASTTHG